MKKKLTLTGTAEHILDNNRPGIVTEGRLYSNLASPVKPSYLLREQIIHTLLSLNGRLVASKYFFLKKEIL